MEGVGVIVSLLVGVVVVVLMLLVFVRRDGYADVGERSDSVEHEHLRRVAEARVSALCPGAIHLAEKERAGGAYGADAVAAREFWRRFAIASASMEEDPVAALGELQSLPGVLEEALRGAEGEAAVAKGTSRGEDGR